VVLLQKYSRFTLPSVAVNALSGGAGPDEIDPHRDGLIEKSLRVFPELLLSTDPKPQAQNTPLDLEIFVSFEPPKVAQYGPPGGEKV